MTNPPHFVLCRPNKMPIGAEWQKRAVAQDRADAHREGGGLIGLIPGSINALVVDVDTKEASDEWRRQAVADLANKFGDPALATVTQSGGLHLWYSVPKDRPRVGNSNWQAGGYGGQVRCDSGFVVLWDYPGWRHAFDAGAFDPDNPLACEIAYANLVRPDGSELSWSEGQRNETLNALAFAAGFSNDSDALVEARTKALEAGLNAKEVDATSKSGWRAGRREGDTVIDELDVLPVEGKKPLAGYDLEGFVLALNACRWRVEEDIRAGRTRIFSAHTETWHPNSKTVRNALRGSMERAAVTKGPKNSRVPWRPAQTRFEEIFDDYAHHRGGSDPFDVWLNDRPAWDHKPRLSRVFADQYDAADTELNRFASILTLLSAVWRTKRPGYKVDTMPVLIGGEGTWKSSFMRLLFPDTAQGRSWASDNIDPYGTDEQEKGIQLQGPVIVEWAEMASTVRFRDRETAKAFITRQSDDFRPKYGTDRVPHPRRCVFYATTNETECLFDGDGNRRFIPVMVGEPSDPTQWFNVNRDQLWAEALWLFTQGRTPVVPGNLRDEHQALCERHRRRGEDLEGWVRSNRDRFQGQTVNEIMDLAPRRFRESDVKAELRRAGFQSSKEKRRGPRRDWRVWRHPDIAQDWSAPEDFENL